MRRKIKDSRRILEKVRQRWVCAKPSVLVFEKAYVIYLFERVVEG